METLVATSIIIIVFVVASLILNNTFRNLMTHDTFSVENRMEELHYLYKNKKLSLPYNEEFKKFEISLDREFQGEVSYLIIEGNSTINTKKLRVKAIDELQ